jgi:hypothetical protein
LPATLCICRMHSRFEDLEQSNQHFAARDCWFSQWKIPFQFWPQINENGVYLKAQCRVHNFLPKIHEIWSWLCDLILTMDNTYEIVHIIILKRCIMKLDSVWWIFFRNYLNVVFLKQNNDFNCYHIFLIAIKLITSLKEDDKLK